MSMSIVQSNHAYPGTGTSLNGVVAGNVLLVTCSWSNTAGTPGISDSMGNGYALLENTSASSNFTRQTVWYAVIGSSGNVSVGVSGGFSDMGLTVMEVNVGGNATSLIVNHTAHTGSANPDTVTLQGYQDGIAIGMYASESTPVANPNGVNLTQLRYDGGHADWQGYAQLTTTAGYTFGYTGSVQNNQNYIGVIFGKFAQPTLSHSTDANKRKVTTRTHTADGYKHIKATRSHTTDANKRKTLLRSHTTDAFIGFNKKHTTDALKRKRFTKTHTTDALKKFVPKRQHTTDAFRHFTTRKTHTTDANLHVAVRRSHTTDARKHVLSGKPPILRSGYKPAGRFRNSGNDKPRVKR